MAIYKKISWLLEKKKNVSSFDFEQYKNEMRLNKNSDFLIYYNNK